MSTDCAPSIASGLRAGLLLLHMKPARAQWKCGDERCKRGGKLRTLRPLYALGTILGYGHRSAARHARASLAALYAFPREAFKRIFDELLDECLDRLIASPVNGQGIEHLEAGQRKQHIHKFSLILPRSHSPDEHRQGLPPSLRSLLQALPDLIDELGHSREFGENLAVGCPKSAEYGDEATQDPRGVRIGEHRWQIEQPSHC